MAVAEVVGCMAAVMVGRGGSKAVMAHTRGPGPTAGRLPEMGRSCSMYRSEGRVEAHLQLFG